MRGVVCGSDEEEIHIWKRSVQQSDPDNCGDIGNAIQVLFCGNLGSTTTFGIHFSTLLQDHLDLRRHFYQWQALYHLLRFGR